MSYAYSWWLDVVSPGWEALVEDNYMAVMPLTRNRKFGFDYLFQPFFTQQLGVFSQEMLSQAKVSSFLDSIPAKYSYIDIQLNTGTCPVNSDFSCTARKNFILDLSPDHIHLSANYHRNCRRNIQKAIQAGLIVKSGLDAADFTTFIKSHLDKQLTGLGKGFYPALQLITNTTIQLGNGEITGVYNRTGKLLAAGWFVTAAGRCIFEVCASSKEGKESQAMYRLVDHAIREKSGSRLIFDFSGSNLPGVAYFNASFGALATTYFGIRRNLLPWPLKMIKK